MPSPLAVLRELAELDLSPDRSYTADDLAGFRAQHDRRGREPEWVIVARGRSRIRKDGEVVSSSEDVPPQE